MVFPAGRRFRRSLLVVAGPLCLLAGWMIGSQASKTVKSEAVTSTTVFRLAKEYRRIRLAPGFQEPKVVRGYYVTPDLAIDVARRVARTAGFEADRLEVTAERWTVDSGNRHFEMERRFGGRWLVRLVDPLCLSPDPCKPGPGIRGAPVSAASSMDARSALEALAEASDLPIRSEEFSGSEVGKLYRLTAPVSLDGAPILGELFGVTVNSAGDVLFAHGFVGPLESSPEVSARKLSDVVKELEATGVVAPDGQRNPKNPKEATFRVRLVYQRVASRGWMVSTMRPFDIVPAYELVSDSKSSYVVPAIEATEVFVGGPASAGPSPVGTNQPDAAPPLRSPVVRPLGVDLRFCASAHDRLAPCLTEASQALLRNGR